MAVTFFFLLLFSVFSKKLSSLHSISYIIEQKLFIHLNLNLFLLLESKKADTFMNKKESSRNHALKRNDQKRCGKKRQEKDEIFCRRQYIETGFV